MQYSPPPMETRGRRPGVLPKPRQDAHFSAGVDGIRVPRRVAHPVTLAEFHFVRQDHRRIPRAPLERSDRRGGPERRRHHEQDRTDPDQPPRGACPIHEEPGAKSRSFAVHTEKNVYCCHRCASQGNALDLWIALSGKPMLAAAWELIETFHLQPPLLKEGPPDTNH